MYRDLKNFYVRAKLNKVGGYLSNFSEAFRRLLEFK